MTKVFVVMSNDYPDSVFSTEAKADAYVEKRMKEQKEEIAKKHLGKYQPSPRIYYRYYEQEVDQESNNVDWKNMYGTYGL